jgi:ATP-dependent Clp protease adaptor protein ClpS
MSKMSIESSTKTRVKIAPNLELTPPPRFKVIFLNDNVTTVQFVMAVLEQIFDHNTESAEELTVKIHEEGQATVAILPHEIAETKAVEVTLIARGNNFPLNVKIEPEV